MTIPTTDGALLSAMQTLSTSKRDANWAEFHARYRDVILGWCMKRGLQQASAEDMTQALLLTLFEKLFSYDAAKARFRSWLKAVVNNALTDYWEQQRRRPEHVGVGSTFLEQLAQLRSPEAANDLSCVIEERTANVASEVLERVRARVEPKTWQAFYETQMEQRPAGDVGEELGLSVGTVYTYVKRVKKMVKEEYGHVQPRGDVAALSPCLDPT